MKNFRILLSMISRNNDMEMPEHGDKAKAYKVMGIIAMCCIMIPCCIVVGFIVYIMTAALMEAGGCTEGLNLVIQLMSVFGVIFSIMVLFNLLYFSSDLDHLLPLPVKPAELVAAKFTHAYFAESVMEFMVLFCGFIGYFVAAEIKPVSVSAQILFAGMRFVLAGILAVIFGSLLEGKFIKPEKGCAGKIVWLAMLQTVIQYLFFYIGLAHTSGVKASIIEAVNVFVAIIVSGFIFHQENVTAKKMLGCLVGFAGVVLINMNGMNFHMSLSGEGAIFLSTVAYAFSSVFLKRYSAKHNPVMLSGYQFIVGGIILSAAGFAMGGRLSTVSTGGVLMLIYLALISAVAYSLWGMLLKYNPISRVAVFGFMNPVFGVILSAWLLREGAQALGPISLVSLVLVCAGIYIVNK